jgi:hypothetical protein
MAFELRNFATSLPINMLIAEREGLARADAVRVGAIASLLVNPIPMSIVVAQLLARRDAPAEAGVTGVRVPDVTLKSQDEATKLLTTPDLGFKVTTTFESSNAVQEGFVIRQQPAANTTAPKSSTVALTISSGSAPETGPG